MLPISFFQKRRDALERLIRSFVEAESPTNEKAAVDAFGRLAASHMERLGADVRQLPQGDVGDHWIGQWGRGRRGILILAHLDTVHPLGALREAPWRVTKDRLFGPGIADMKGGIAMALTALRALRDEKALPDHRVTLFCNSDEEIGSPTSRRAIEKLAQGHDVTFCLEAATTDGALKTQRKGAGRILLRTFGLAAHAGSSPHRGVNAIVEMAQQIARLQALADERTGTTISVGIIEGGTRRNVVPDACRAEADVRVASASEEARIEQALAGIEPILSGARVSAEILWSRPVMERTPKIAEAFARAKAIGEALGLRLAEQSVGGASDANFVGAIGLPVLDGLGPIGERSHAKDEQVDRTILPERTALLAALVSDWFSRA